MKLKLFNKDQTASEGAPAGSPTNEAPAPTPTSATTPGGGVKLKFKSFAAPEPAESQPSNPPKQKRKYTKKPKLDENGDPIPPAPKAAKPPKPKKRAREENGEDGPPTSKRKVKPTAKSLALARQDDESDDELVAEVSAPAPLARAGTGLKLKVKPTRPSAPARSGTTLIKIKGIHGKPPDRPPGAGYDSEAEEAEEDPAIESQFVLRMQPGPDCDTLRKAIEDKTIGKPVSSGGTNVQFRFFDRDGRRATVSISGHLYAAAMVDLPCVVESMKSWNKKDWVKTADVCQMLLVLGRVQSEEEAKKYPLPREVNPDSHQFAHGLTPPMHYVRKRRFRPRVSYHRIEQIEAEVNALLEADRRISSNGGRIDWQIVDADRDMTSDEEDSDVDGEGEDDDMGDPSHFVIEGETPGGEEVEVDGADLEQMLEAGLMEDDDDADGLFGDGLEGEPATTSHDVAMHALGEAAAHTTETAASTPAGATSGDDDDDDDDDADSQGDANDAEAAAAQEGREQQLAEIRELQQEIDESWKQYNTFNNILYKQRCKAKIERLTTDLELKKAALGVGDDAD